MVVGMREIKFRALCDGELIYQSDTHSFNIGGPHGDECLAWLGFDLIGSKKIDKLEQYTGLKDIYGNEIYEGDIIKSKSYPFYSDAPEMDDGKEEPVELNYLGVIGIDVDGVYYDLKVVSDRVSGRACGGSLSEICESVEVIGNIHENPELLEGL